MNKKVFLDIIAGATALGRIEIELFYDITPKTCENFRGLCTGEYGIGRISKKKLCYKGSKIHKIVEDQYIEGGDIVYGNGRGGESIYGEFFSDENFKRRHACAGLISMGNVGRNTNSSKFIITLKPCPFLDDKNVVFGQVINGMNVVRQIAKIPTDSLMRPQIKVMIFDCGDYDTRRIHLREDVFKETIDAIVEDRLKKEKVKILGPEEAEKYRQLKQKSAFDFEQTYEDDQKNEKGQKGKNKHKESSSSEEDDDDYEEEDEDIEKEQADLEGFMRGIQSKIKSKDKQKEMIEKFRILNGKINEAKNLNNKAVLDENQDNFGENKDKKMSKMEWKNKVDEQKRIMKAQGVPENKSYVYDSIRKNEAIKEYNKKKEKNQSFGWDAFNTEAYYRAYKKRLKHMPFDKDLYDKEMNGEIKDENIVTEEKKDLLKADIEQQIQQREKFSRRRKFFEDQDVNYINERNRLFNKKLERFFGKEASEIKTNLERGTAVQ